MGGMRGLMIALAHLIGKVILMSVLIYLTGILVRSGIREGIEKIKEWF